MEWILEIEFLPKEKWENIIKYSKNNIPVSPNANYKWFEAINLVYYFMLVTWVFLYDKGDSNVTWDRPDDKP